jgi:phospholipase C
LKSDVRGRLPDIRAIASSSAVAVAGVAVTGCVLAAQLGGIAVAASDGPQLRRQLLEGPHAAAATTQRALCAFPAGARATETLGLDARARAAIPIRHVVVVMQENRSFDHYFGRLAQAGQPDAEGFPETFSNPDRAGQPVFPHRLPTTCVADDPPHQWDAMYQHWNQGRMDGFVRIAAGAGTDGHHAMGYHDESQLPFYHWLGRTFAISDRHFSSALSGTWHNRQFAYAATARYRGRTGMLDDVPTIFDALDTAGVSWGVFTAEGVRQDCLGWKRDHRGVFDFATFLGHLRAGTLPAVSFVDPAEADEHPPADVQKGEAWTREIYQAAVKSPLWSKLAVFFTYDEGGGFFDHVPPPTACAPSPQLAMFTRLGIRVPLVLISPWARPRFVSHRPTEHTAMLRFIQLLFDLPALTMRDANADALLDLFDFRAPRLLRPGRAPEAGQGGCPNTGEQTASGEAERR